MKPNNKLLYAVALLVFVIVIVAVSNLHKFGIPALIAVGVLNVAMFGYALQVPIYRERLRKSIVAIVLFLVLVGVAAYFIFSKIR